LLTRFKLPAVFLSKNILISPTLHSRRSCQGENCAKPQCDERAIKHEFNITGNKAPREDAYKYKYLLDVDGNTSLGDSLACFALDHWFSRFARIFLRVPFAFLIIILRSRHSYQGENCAKPQCDEAATKHEFNITGDKAPREDAHYKYK
jgi:hypothetical protein